MYPEIAYIQKVEMNSIRLDTLIENIRLEIMPNVIVVDTQGADLLVLKGSERILSEIDAMYAEASSTPLYEGGCSVDEIAAFLRKNEIPIIWTEMFEAHGWGNAFFMRSNPPNRKFVSIEHLPRYSGNIAIGKNALFSSSLYDNINDRTGITNGIIRGEFGFHSKKELNPWVIIDLEK